MERRRGGIRVPFREIARVVENPRAASVGADHQVLLPGMDQNVVEEGGREIRHPGPAASRVGAGEERVLRAEEKDVRVVRMLSQHVHRARGQTGCQRRPGAAKVRGPGHIGVEVPVPVSVEGGVGRARRRHRTRHATHIGPVRYAVHVAAHLRPGIAAVTGNLNVAVVRAHPEDIGIKGGLGDGDDLAVARHPIVPRDADVRPGHAHELQCVPVGGPGQVLGRLPALAPVPRDEESVPGHVHRLRIVLRHQAGRDPVEPIRLALRRARTDVEDVAGLGVDPGIGSVLGVSVGVAGAGRVRLPVHAVAEADLPPVVVDDPDPVTRAGGTHPRVVVLQPPVDPVRVLHVHADVVELSDGEVI